MSFWDKCAGVYDLGQSVNFKVAAGNQENSDVTRLRKKRRGGKSLNSQLNH